MAVADLLPDMADAQERFAVGDGRVSIYNLAGEVDVVAGEVVCLFSGSIVQPESAGRALERPVGAAEWWPTRSSAARRQTACVPAA